MSEADIDRQLDERLRRSAESNTETNDYGVHATANAPQLIQVETLGRNGMAVLWLSAWIAAAAVVTTIAFAFWIDRVSARVYVLEYDAGRICARLQEKEIVEGCH